MNHTTITAIKQKTSGIPHARTFVAIASATLLFSCTTPRIIEQQHHHHYEADTLAVQAQVDRRMSSWHEQIESTWKQHIDEYTAASLSQDEQKEHITETVTTITDSLGRQIRTEQRTTERSLSRMQQLTEQRLTKEFEGRLQQALEQQDSAWLEKFNKLQAHFEQADSTSVKETPVTTTETPWYKRWWRNLKDYLLIAAIIFILLVTSRSWLPLCINLFRKK